MIQYTLATAWKRLLDTDATDTSFASKVPTVTAPNSKTTDGVIDLQPTRHNLGNNDEETFVVGGPVAHSLQFVFYGTDANNETMNVRILGWAPVKMDGQDDLWIPTVLYEGSVTLGATTGVSGHTISNSYFFADTISDPTTGNDNVDSRTTSPTGDEIAHLDLDVKGFPKIEVQFDSTAAASMNAIYRELTA